MTVITESLIRRRAEHNGGLIFSLEEVALHQQNIEKIELLGRLCPHLKIIYLQNNLISKIQNLHKLKELEYLNLAVNNITKIQNLQRCESLQKLDLTVNFIPKAGLLTIASLQLNYNLKELFLLGNPCVDWPGYRHYVVGKLPQLKKLDGKDIKPSDRIMAQQALAELEQQLHDELRAEGINPATAAEVEDDSMFDENGEVKETGYMDENGEMRRPWCPATRILEHREMEAANRDADEKKKSAKKTPWEESPSTSAPLREGFPVIAEGERVFQKNEGDWDFSLLESDDGRSVVLDVTISKFMDTSLIKADVQPTYVRLLIKGRLLQLVLPCEVLPDRTTAQRSKTTGHLVLTMPKERPGQSVHDAVHLRSHAGQLACGTSGSAGPQEMPSISVGAAKRPVQKAALEKKGASIYNITASSEDGFSIREIRKAVVQASSGPDGDMDYVPPL